MESVGIALHLRVQRHHASASARPHAPVSSMKPLYIVHLMWRQFKANLWICLRAIRLPTHVIKNIFMDFLFLMSLTLDL